jgi:hypothetical protein
MGKLLVFHEHALSPHGAKSDQRHPWDSAEAASSHELPRLIRETPHSSIQVAREKMSPMTAAFKVFESTGGRQAACARSWRPTVNPFGHISISAS